MDTKFTFISKKEKPIRFDFEKEMLTFLNAKKIEKRSPKTVEAYEQVLAQFHKWIQANLVDIITSECIRSYIQ